MRPFACSRMMLWQKVRFQGLLFGTRDLQCEVTQCNEESPWAHDFFLCQCQGLVNHCAWCAMMAMMRCQKSCRIIFKANFDAGPRPSSWLCFLHQVYPSSVWQLQVLASADVVKQFYHLWPQEVLEHVLQSLFVHDFLWLLLFDLQAWSVNSAGNVW